MTPAYPAQKKCNSMQIRAKQKCIFQQIFSHASFLLFSLFIYYTSLSHCFMSLFQGSVICRKDCFVLIAFPADLTPCGRAISSVRHTSGYTDKRSGSTWHEYSSIQQQRIKCRHYLLINIEIILFSEVQSMCADCRMIAQRGIAQ